MFPFDIFSAITATSTFATAVFAFKRFSTFETKLNTSEDMKTQFLSNNRTNPIIITRYVAKNCTFQEIHRTDAGKGFFADSGLNIKAMDYPLYCGAKFNCDTYCYANGERVPAKNRLVSDFFNGFSFDNFYIEITPLSYHTHE